MGKGDFVVGIHVVEHAAQGILRIGIGRAVQADRRVIIGIDMFVGLQNGQLRAARNLQRLHARLVLGGQ